MEPVSIREGGTPLILAVPHAGTLIPTKIGECLNDRGRMMADTDWNVDRLYHELAPEATMIKANFHRYVIDANRGPEDASLYPGQNTTGLCPVTDFDGEPIWRGGGEPTAEEIAARREEFHRPYHAAIEAAIDKARGAHGVAVLYDCHSIRSEIPYLFDGKLPALNIGTNGGKSCSPRLEALIATMCAGSDYASVVNGRFKGGWTTRHYGDPANGVHAIQMEIAQRTYMSEALPWDYDPAKAETLRTLLKSILNAAENAARNGEL